MCFVDQNLIQLTNSSYLTLALICYIDQVDGFTLRPQSKLC